MHSKRMYKLNWTHCVLYYHLPFNTLNIIIIKFAWFKLGFGRGCRIDSS
jgi:hypothetical protein